MLRPLLVAASVLLLAPGVAHATHLPDTTVDFERVPAGQQVNDQYASPEGVDFGAPEEFAMPKFNVSCGLPVAQDGGIAGRSAEIACMTKSGTDATRQHIFNAAFNFTTTRRRVSFRLRHTAEADGRKPAEVRFYAPGGVLLNQQLVAFPSAGKYVDVSYEHPSASRIAGVWIQQGSPLDRTNEPPVYLDDIRAPVDDQLPPREFALALVTPTISVVEGSTADATVAVRRYNGSTGPVTLSIEGGNPPGIVGAEFIPTAVSGTAPAILRVAAGSPFTGTRQLSVKGVGSADAGTAANGPLTQTVIGLPAVQLGNESPATLIRGCGFQDVRDRFTVRGNYGGTVRLGPTGAATGPASLRIAAPAVRAEGDGTYPFTMQLDPGDNAGGGTYNVVARPESATPAFAGRSYTIDEVRVSSVTGALDRPLFAGRGITVTGNFPAGCPLIFRDQHNVDWNQRTRTRAIVDGRFVDQIVLDVPIRATSGPLTVLSSATGTVLTRTPALDITAFRNVFGFSQGNSGAGACAPDYHWEQFRETFGSDDVDRCFLGVCGRDPVAEKYHQRYLGQVTSYNGLCAGWSIMAMRFAGVDGVRQAASSYEPGARRAWQISQFGDTTAVKRDIVRWHVAQSDKPFVEAREAGRNRSAADERNVLRARLARYGGTYIAIRSMTPTGSSGHAVVGYAIEENVPAQAGEQAPVMLVRIYDPNVPYSAAEENTAATRTSNQSLSSLRIDANGNWSGANFPWSGNNAALSVVDRLPLENATLPTSSFLVFFEVSGGEPVTQLQSIKSGGAEALGAGGEPRPGSGVSADPFQTGVKAQPAYELAPGRAYEASMRGLRAGRYEQGQYTSDAVATVEATTAPGQVDSITVRPGEPELAFATGASRTAVRYDLADRTGGATRAAEITTTGVKGGGDRVELERGVARIDHSGPATTATLKLTSVGEGLPTSVTTAALRVGRNERLAVAPRAWSDLAAGARYTVKNRRGRVVRSGTVRLRGTGAVSLAGVRARVARGVVTVAGRVTKRGQSPLLAAVAEAVRGGRVVKRAAASLRGAQVRAGSFSLPIRLGRLPRGAKLRVKVTLADEAAGLTGVRRTATVRR